MKYFGNVHFKVSHFQIINLKIPKYFTETHLAKVRYSRDFGDFGGSKNDHFLTIKIKILVGKVENREPKKHFFHKPNKKKMLKYFTIHLISYTLLRSAGLAQNTSLQNESSHFEVKYFEVQNGNFWVRAPIYTLSITLTPTNSLQGPLGSSAGIPRHMPLERAKVVDS